MLTSFTWAEILKPSGGAGANYLSNSDLYGLLKFLRPGLNAAFYMRRIKFIIVLNKLC